jgi:hypothetical protein
MVNKKTLRGYCLYLLQRQYKAPHKNNVTLYIVFFYRGIKFHQQRSNLVAKMSAHEHASSEKVRESGNKLHTIWAYCLTTRI